MEHIDLLATCWTSAGDAAPQRGDEVSPVPLDLRVESLARAGWSGIGLVHADLVEIAGGIGYAEFARRLDDAGIPFREVEILADWWTDGPQREAADRLREDLFAAAEALGARSMKALAALDEAPPWDVFVREFRELARRAGDSGVLLAIEPMPFSSNIRTVEDGVRLLEDVDHPSAGLVLDTWHLYRAGTPYAEIPELVPAELIAVVEINDCAREPVGTPWDDTVNNRMFPGRGDADTAEFVHQVHRAGFRGPWGVEIISEELRGMPVEEGLRVAHDTSLAAVREGIRRASA